MKQPIAITVFLLIFTAMAFAQQTGENVSITQPASRDLYLAGERIEVSAPVQGDVAAAGYSVLVQAPVGGDVIAAAERVAIEADVSDDLRLAGRRVDITADVGDHVVAFGETITVGQGHRVGGFAWLAGQNVHINGAIGGDLKVTAGTLVIAAPVNGNVEVTAERIEVRPGAEIAGDLIWRSERPPQIAADATVGGRLVERPLPPERGPSVAAALVAGLAILAGLLVTGIVGYLLFPRYANQTVEAVRGAPFKSLGLGLAVFAASPIVIALLMATGIGVLLALLLLALYLVALPLGWLAGAYCTGRYTLSVAGKESNSRRRQMGAFAIATVVLFLLQLIPFVGFFIALAVLLFGLGGLGLTANRRYAGSAEPSGAQPSTR